MSGSTLTRAQRREVRDLVHQCANYMRTDRLCLLLDAADRPGDCPMLTLDKAGKVCRYFRAAVLPLNPVLEAALTAQAPVAMRSCTVCGNEFVPTGGRQQYCGAKCQQTAHRRQAKERMRKYREKAGVDVTL